MQITRISEQAKNKDRVNIYIDGRYSLSLTLAQLLDEKLKVGADLTAADVKRLQKLSADGKLKMRTMEWLMLRPHSAKELKEYLRRKKLDAEQIESWAQEMQAYGYQSDEQFARWWVDQRRGKLRSERFIASELRSKGIADDIIKGVLSHDEATDASALTALIAKKRRNARYQDNKKLTEYLMRQGYRYSDITEALTE